MTWTPHIPRHLSPAPADTGASNSALYYVAKRASAPTHVGAYADAWAGNPDTDKHWGKNR